MVSEPTILAAFAAFDSDQDGLLTREEVEALMTRRTTKGGPPLTQLQLVELLEELGTSDGKLSYAPVAKRWATPEHVVATLSFLPKPARRGVNAGVNMRWLKGFAKQVPPGMSTLDVVLTIIKPRTKKRLCRFVALAEEDSPGAVGRARVFASHTWKAPFLDLVAALGHLLSDDDFVWIDVRTPPTRCARPPSDPRAPPLGSKVFAVLQWDAKDGLSEAQVKEKTDDLDFKAVVQATDALVLVGTHVEAVARLSDDDAFGKRVPEEARQRSAFFRVWCLVEMAAALEAEKPVVLLVGAAAGEGEELRFLASRPGQEDLEGAGEHN